MTAKTTETIHFGRLLRNALVPFESFSIANRAVGHAEADTAGLDLDSFTPNAGPLVHNLTKFTNYPAGTTGNYLVSAGTDTSGTFERTVTIGLSDQDLPGAGAPGSQVLTLNLHAVVGHARPDTSNDPDAFGPDLGAITPLFRPYAGLESTVVGLAGGIGQQPATGSTATILDGTNSSGLDKTVAMAWRAATTDEAGRLFGDVVALAGMANSGLESGPTDPFVLRMDYDEALLPADEAALAAAGELFLGWRDGQTGLWLNAIEGNFGLNTGPQNVQGKWTPGLPLGSWGVNVDRNTVWAVVDHNSQFASAPEPATLALLAMGAVAALRRRRHR